MEFSREDKIKMIEGKKKFFLKSFAISLVLFLLSALILVAGRYTWAGMAYVLYGVEPRHYPLILGLVMGFWKILIIQFTLVPYVALYMIERCVKSKAE